MVSQGQEERKFHAESIARGQILSDLLWKTEPSFGQPVPTIQANGARRIVEPSWIPSQVTEQREEVFDISQVGTLGKVVIHPSIHLYTHPPVHLSVHTHPSVCPCIYPLIPLAPPVHALTQYFPRAHQMTGCG